MLLMVAIVALAYAIANAFSLPDLKAWADVELGEIFASALLLIFILGTIFFIDAAIRGTVGPAFPTACPSGGGEFCPAAIAHSYLSSYITSAESAYKDITVKNIEKAREATSGGSAGLQDMIYAYLTFSFRYAPQEMVWVETYDQLLQNLGTVLSTLQMQKFMVDFLTLKLAPIAIFLGIIMRSFFLTRKLGGLLLAFGLGFLIIFPMCYALAWFTLDSMIYGGQKAPTGPVMACPEVCVPGSKIAQYLGSAIIGEGDTTQIRQEAYDGCMSSMESLDPSGRSTDCLAAAASERANCVSSCKTTTLAECLSGCGDYCISQDLERAGTCTDRCKEHCRGLGLTEPIDLYTDEEMAAWTACMDPCEAENGCAAEDAAWNGCMGGCTADRGCDITSETIASECDAACPLRECPIVVGDKEAYCNAEADDKMEKLANGSIINVGVCPSDTCKTYGRCQQTSCGFPVPYYREGCSTYRGTPNICNTRPFESDDPAYADLTDSELNGCPEKCRTLAPMKTVSETSCRNWRCTEYYSDDDLCKAHTGHDYCVIDYSWDRCKKYGQICPSQCMWITTSGRNDSTCPRSCQGLYPSNPEYLWENNLSSQTCVYIVPDVVFDQPDECGACAFVAEKGLTFKPQMIFDCTDLCGAPGNAVMAEDPATMTSKIGGMIGPAELITVSKLMVPAYVLPMFALAVALMFVTALSPMLGGDIDIPGMMRMIQ